MKDTKKPTTDNSVVSLPSLDNLPELQSEITNSEWFINTINNPSLKNVGGDYWKMQLLECLDKKTGVYTLDLVKTKIEIMVQFGKRPPRDGFGSNGTDYSEKMKTTKQQIISLINNNSNENGCFVGESGKQYKIQNPFFREYVEVDGKMKMLTTLKRGTTYKDHNGKKVTK